MMGKTLGLALVALLVTARAAQAFDHTHAAWDKWLKEHATATGPVTTVNYKAAKEKPDSLNAYVKTVTSVTREEYDKFSADEKLAFLINSYNALTVKLIVDNYPVKSIKDIGNVFTSPWKKKFFSLLGEEMNLDGIEHGMIRKNWNEPRIHFAVVCASKGCPQLRPEAYVAARVTKQLDEQASSFLKDSSRNKYVAAENKLMLSKIFDWYGGDFVKKAGSVPNFVAPRMAANKDEEEKIKKADVSFLDYDWTLNETTRSNAGG